MKNRWLEVSAKAIQSRIKSLTEYRAIILSDKAIYLGAFRYVVAMHSFMCMTAAALVLAHSELKAVYEGMCS